jgi:hypothetical protein
MPHGPAARRSLATRGARSSLTRVTPLGRNTRGPPPPHGQDAAGPCGTRTTVASRARAVRSSGDRLLAAATTPPVGSPNPSSVYHVELGNFLAGSTSPQPLSSLYYYTLHNGPCNITYYNNTPTIYKKRNITTTTTT